MVIVAELRTRREAREAAAQVASQVAALASYYKTSVGGSVLADYRSGNVTIIKAN